jgi:hypothetical protein
VAAGVLTVLAVLGADASTRELIALRLRGKPAYSATTAAVAQPALVVNPVTSPSNMPAPAAADPPVDHRADAFASVSPPAAASESVASPKTAHPRGPKKKAAPIQ